MPELPEVQALAADLDGRLRGRVVARLELLSFAALKTFDPPVSALADQVVDSVARHGKFLDFSIGDVHWSCTWPGPGGCAGTTGRARRRRPAGKSPLAARLVLDDGSGIDITEAGTKKSLAIYLVRTPTEVPGIARLGPDPLSESFTLEAFRGILAAAGRAQIKGVLRNQSIIAGIGNAYSDEILHAARMSPFKPASMGAGGGGPPLRRDAVDAAGRHLPVGGAGGIRAQEGEEVRDCGCTAEPANPARSAVTPCAR